MSRYCQGTAASWVLSLLNVGPVVQHSNFVYKLVWINFKMYYFLLVAGDLFMQTENKKVTFFFFWHYYLFVVSHQGEKSSLPISPPLICFLVSLLLSFWDCVLKVCSSTWFNKYETMHIWNAAIFDPGSLEAKSGIEHGKTSPRNGLFICEKTL